MAIPLNINGAVFEYPENFDEQWGVAATGWAQAVTNGMLQMQGGSFPLTADVNFGPTFGLRAQYFETRSGNPATVGTIRLASADPGIAWRNSANNANLILTTDVSDNLLFQGSTIVVNGYSPTFSSLTLTSPLTVPNGGTGTTSFVPYSVLTGGTTSTGPVQSVASVGIAGQVLASNGPGLLPTFQTVAGTGTINPSNTGYIAQYLTNGTTLYGNAAFRFSGGGGGNDLVLDSANQTTFHIVSTTAGIPILSFENTAGTDQVFMNAIGDMELHAGASFLKLTRVGNIFDVLVTMRMNGNRIEGVGTPTTPGDAAQFPITSSQITSGAVRGSTANSGGSAREISQGTISTPDFRANAVTQQQTSASGSVVTNTTITSKSITTIGGPVLIVASASLDGVNGTILGQSQAYLQTSVDRGGTAIPGATQEMLIRGYLTTGSQQIFPCSIMAVDTPAAGTYTYNFNYANGGGFTSVNEYSLVLIELRA